MLSRKLPLLTLTWILTINTTLIFLYCFVKQFAGISQQFLLCWWGTTLKDLSALFWHGCWCLFGWAFFPLFLIANSLPNTTLTKSFSTKKEERSTKTHVGIMKNTAWHPSMFSNRRWCIRESLNTWQKKLLNKRSSATTAHVISGDSEAV